MKVQNDRIWKYVFFFIFSYEFKIFHTKTEIRGVSEENFKMTLLSIKISFAPLHTDML